MGCARVALTSTYSAFVEFPSGVQMSVTPKFPALSVDTAREVPGGLALCPVCVLVRTIVHDIGKLVITPHATEIVIVWQPVIGFMIYRDTVG